MKPFSLACAGMLATAGEVIDGPRRHTFLPNLANVDEWNSMICPLKKRKAVQPSTLIIYVLH